MDFTITGRTDPVVVGAMMAHKKFVVGEYVFVYKMEWVKTGYKRVIGEDELARIENISYTSPWMEISIIGKGSTWRTRRDMRHATPNEIIAYQLEN